MNGYAQAVPKGGKLITSVHRAHPLGHIKIIPCLSSKKFENLGREGGFFFLLSIFL